MNDHRIRNTLPAIYGLLVMGGFFISSVVGVTVAVVGGMLIGIMWSGLSGGAGTGARGRARSARAARRADRR